MSVDETSPSKKLKVKVEFKEASPYWPNDKFKKFYNHVRTSEVELLRQLNDWDGRKKKIKSEDSPTEILKELEKYSPNLVQNNAGFTKKDQNFADKLFSSIEKKNNKK